MSLSITVGPLTPAEVQTAIAALTAAGIGLGGQVGAAPPTAPTSPPRTAPPMPPMAAGGVPVAPMAPVAPAAPPAPPTPPAAPVSPRQKNVLDLMGAYAKAGHGAAGVKKVLQQVNISRVQEANE